MPSVPSLIWDAPRNPYLAVGIPLVLGTGSGYAVHGQKSNFWYNSLKAPTGTAPRESFGIVWPILYALSGFGSYVVAQNLDAPGLNTGALNPSARNTAIEALNLYWVSLGLNLAWSPLFFGLQRPALALADIVALTGVVGALTVKAHSLPKWNGIAASLFFAPYAAWTLYATYLNGGFYLENYSLSGTRRTPKAL